ncbi:MAG: SWF/SNF helicase family protein, partial [Phaeodactylibacter sp.]|nr:SWF/SNF helicase family protein [Phaeodactylibacter sp.]
FGLEVPFLHGGVSRKGRDTMVENFQNNRATRIMLLSLKAGGTGLNLTAAANVIHYDLWWNPAVESQATDRAYRIGQESNVMVHRFITQGTFEEKINTLLQNKKELAELAVASGEQWIGELGNEELRELVRLG